MKAILPPVLLLCYLVCTPRLFGYDRFPQPEFSSGYTLPDTTTPAGRSAFLEYLDVAVLVAALLLSAFLALKLRSRSALVLLSLFSAAYFGFWRRGCVCSVGSIQNVALALADPSYAVPIPVLAFFLLPLIAALFFGRTFCGSVCPLGAVQDLVLVRPLRVPRWLSEVLGVFPYLYLGLTLLLAASGTAFLACRLDPFVSLFRLSGNLNVILYSASFLLLSLFIGRPYCRFLCPYGVLLGWMSRFSRRHTTVTPEDCVRCRLCTDSCPYDAIREASDPDERGLADRLKHVRRFALSLALLPILVGAGAWSGSRLNVPLARMSAAVCLAEQVQREDAGIAEETTLESRTFRASGQSTEQLLEEAADIRKRLGVGGWILGGLVGFVLGFRIVSLNIPRHRENTEPDRGACVGCGRCFASCPVEQRRRRNRRRPAAESAARGGEGSHV